ncbi:hypothetical protein [Amycolatopsis minnesotensis]|uniref:Glycosyl transferase n=1 Tax=Amycolatopsis minnesotensis TaxID=337894 RepID=A0ABN2R915_9PSEU
MIDERHLLRLSDDAGLFEHACGPIPRREHGYCLDDAARGLVLLSREPDLTPDLARLQETLFAFTAHAHEEGYFHNRLGYDRDWQDTPGAGDWWGRAVWGLGSTAAHAGRSWLRAEARLLFDSGARRRSPSPRSMVFAGLGAAELLLRWPSDETAKDLLAAAVAAVGPIPLGRGWPWPHPRLTYANAAVAELLIAAGESLSVPAALADGLRMLDWLVDLQTLDGHLSVVPVGGWAPRETPPGFDQQPIEVAALASACARAQAVTGTGLWASTVDRAMGWFLGANDAGVALLDRDTGGCGDGLRGDGVNRNQGAESLLASLSTFQLDRLSIGVLAGTDAA